jgi:hypothetical protein
MKASIAIFGSLLLLPIAGAEAQPRPAPSSLESLLNCRGEKRERERLLCFDTAAAALSQAVESRALVVMDQEAVKNTRRTLFGFDVGRLPFFGSSNDAEPETKEIVAKLKSARASGFRKWLLELENGAFWETTEPTDVMMPKAGDQITIRKSAGGGYMIHLGSRLIRARRVR